MFMNTNINNNKNISIIGRIYRKKRQKQICKLNIMLKPYVRPPPPPPTPLSF